MKSILLSAVFSCLAVAAFAGVALVPEVPVTPVAVTPPDASSGSSGEGAFLLLALVGIVIASGQLGGLATRNGNKLDIDETDADDNAGF